MSETVTVAYSADGAIAELEITDPQNNGRTVGTVERGATIDVPKHVADDLVQREDFSPSETPEQKAKREKAEQDKAEQDAAAEQAADDARKKVAAEQAKANKGSN